jgi:hypothetical protein
MEFSFLVCVCVWVHTGFFWHSVWNLLLNIAMKCWFSENTGNYQTSKATISFSRRSRLLGVIKPLPSSHYVGPITWREGVTRLKGDVESLGYSTGDSFPRPTPSSLRRDRSSHGCMSAMARPFFVLTPLNMTERHFSSPSFRLVFLWKRIKEKSWSHSGSLMIARNLS